jgi:hypothetical protein
MRENFADLSNNVIEEVQDNYAKNRFKLDKLLLRENLIQVLTKSSFKNFQWLNYTSLEGNPIYSIGMTLYYFFILRTALKNSIDLEGIRKE